jgi:hypothetical protein
MSFWPVHAQLQNSQAGLATELPRYQRGPVTRPTGASVIWTHVPHHSGSPTPSGFQSLGRF